MLDVVTDSFLDSQSFLFQLYAKFRSLQCQSARVGDHPLLVLLASVRFT